MSSTSTLKSRVVRGASWVFAGHIFSQLLRLASNLIMTRLLVPEMFGLMAIANIVMIGLTMMSDIGIRQHIIQSKHSDSVLFLNTAWVVQIIRGLVLWGFALLISVALIRLGNYNVWPTDSVYANPLLPYVIGILAFTAVLNGFESTNLALANRNLAIKNVVSIELISQFVGIVIMVSWAYNERTIWPLVGGAITTSFVKMMFSHIFLPGEKNKFCWDRDSFYELFHFGKWIFLTSILGFLAINGDRLILGGLIDTKLLGIYTIAVFIIGAIQQVFNKIIGSVALPALSEVARERPDDLINVYYKFRLPVDAIMLFLAGFLFVAGGNIIDILYDDRYKQAGNILEILSLSLLFERYSLAGQCFIALGRPSFLISIILARTIFLYIGLPTMYSMYGIDAGIWAIVLSAHATLPIILYYKVKNSLLSVYKEILTTPFLLIGLVIGYGAEHIYIAIKI